MQIDLPSLESLRASINDAYLADETATIERLLPLAALDADQTARIATTATRLVNAVRLQQRGRIGIESFLQEFKLSSQEGVLLMCIAEALLRIPDTATTQKLIRDKFAQGDWEKHLGQSESLLINASTWGLMLTGRMVALDDEMPADATTNLKRLITTCGAEVVRLALSRAMGILAGQFVIGRNIEAALQKSRSGGHARYRYSFDMLGEAALTRTAAQNYFAAYVHAIAAAGKAEPGEHDAVDAPGISVKLSALHPRYEYSQRDRAVPRLAERLADLALQACMAKVALTVDAEESERLDLSLEIFARVFGDPRLAAYQGLGIAVQAYQKRALPVIDWLAALARSQNKRIALRLVKGAYWDSEIKRAQAQGLADYPVFTRKLGTDVSYLACAKRMLEAGDALYPQFATHNAHTVAAILELARGKPQFEFQRLHGMGEALYDAVLEQFAGACRVYAPVGNHQDLLPYLVRRLLENGANTSFVHSVADPAMPIEKLVADPVVRLRELDAKRNPKIPVPPDLYAPARRNSLGINFAGQNAVAELARLLQAPLDHQYQAGALTGGEAASGPTREIRSPADRQRLVGMVMEADERTLERALTIASEAQTVWQATPAEERAAILERAADLIEAKRVQFLALLVRESGKTLPDALAEVREAADYCRYYALMARRHFAAPQTLPGITGESNQIGLHGRGVFAAISPWNFPLAICVGQVSAALAAGNTVIAKPARQTPLAGFHAIQLLHQAGIPKSVLHFLPGPGASLGQRLISDARIAGVVFTGSTNTAKAINLALAEKPGPMVPLIAETGGQNAMIVDSSALPEQVAIDVLQSAFNSAGQRCSALRVLFLQDEIAERVIELLRGAMEQLVIGDPLDLATDVGPVIDAAAQTDLFQHIEKLRTVGKLLVELRLSPQTRAGSFVAPCAFEIPRLELLQQEVFGPVLHVIRYSSNRLDQVVDAINRTGYGLTLGIQSRIDTTVQTIRERARVGNVYVNRNMIGAVVGVQPFGGEGLSGTGPKAGGPNYLQRFATERTISINTAAAGGNAALLAMNDED